MLFIHCWLNCRASVFWLKISEVYHFFDFHIECLFSDFTFQRCNTSCIFTFHMGCPSKEWILPCMQTTSTPASLPNTSRPTCPLTVFKTDEQLAIQELREGHFKDSHTQSCLLRRVKDSSPDMWRISHCNAKETPKVQKTWHLYLNSSKFSPKISNNCKVKCSAMAAKGVPLQHWIYTSPRKHNRGWHLSMEQASICHIGFFYSSTSQAGEDLSVRS